MAEQLTHQQHQAVFDRGGDLLVSAAAGSGKTKVLVERLMQYITDPNGPANIDDFLIITYTKAAAAELRGKIAKALSQRIAQDPGNSRLQRQFQRLYLAKISTVHSFCTDILREYAYMLDIPGDFRMIEEQEDEPLRRQVLDAVLSEAYERIGEDSNFAAFVDSQGVGRNDRDLPELILKVYDSAKCHKDWQGWLDRCLKYGDVSGAMDVSQTLWGRFLMDNLFDCIDQNCLMLERTAALCDVSDGLDKMAAVIRDIHSQLTAIRQAKTWDEIHKLRNLDEGNIRGISAKKNLDKEAYAKAKIVRDLCTKQMEDLLRDFGNDSEQILRDLRQTQPAVYALLDLVRRFAQRYDRVKKGLRVMDFSDLEHKALDLLWGKSRSGPTAAARQIGERYAQIMVDEYQDSNEVQDAIFRALSNGRDNLFMVGDVKQSIYQFRLADPGIFMDKYARFCAADQALPGQGRKIVLSNNFRSGPGVIEAVNSVFGECMCQKVGGLDYGDEEALWEGVPHEPLPDRETELHVIDVHADTYAEEAEFVAGRIEELLDGNHMVRGETALRPIVPEDIVILLRSPRTSGWDFHYALHKRGFSTVSSNALDLLSTDEVDWLRSLLQAINNPRQDIPFIAAITGPVFGFTADDLASVRGAKKNALFFDALCQSDLEKARAFTEVLSQLRTYNRMHTLPELMEQIYLLTGADVVYGAMPDGQERSANLRDFYRFVVRFSATPSADLQGLLDYIQQCEGDGLGVSRQAGTDGSIQITSIHKSKGLEYPVVFLCGLSRSFNMQSSNGTILCDPELGLGLSCVDNTTRIRYPSIANRAISRKTRADSISEELRVLYVAMTRPKDRLIMTYAQSGMPEKLEKLSASIDLAPKQMLLSRANCLGSWVLFTAMQRTEAGQLFAQGGKPEHTLPGALPWKIKYHEATAVDEPIELKTLDEADPLDERVVQNIRTALSFRYPHLAATTVPSKQTATQKKGRLKDQEVAENAAMDRHSVRQWRKLNTSLSRAAATEYGNAVHAAMQHINFSQCTDTARIQEELARLVDTGLLKAEQLQKLNVDAFAAFFDSPLGRQICAGKNVLREFKFSLLDDAAQYAPGVSGEKVLLQGVVDCALIEDDGITVVDFKTDKVTEDTVDIRAESYREQIQTYADALGRIFKLPVKKSFLYFFALRKFYPM